MSKIEDDEDYKDTRKRVVTFLEEDEKENLEKLAWRSGRSVSGYIRHLIIEAIELASD